MARQQTFAFAEPVSPNRPFPAQPAAQALPSRAAGGSDAVAAGEGNRVKPSPAATASDSPKGRMRSQLVQPLVQTPPTREQILCDLRAKAGCITTAQEIGPVIETFSTGHAELDALLPRGGLKVDSVAEWVGDNHASAGGALSLVTAAGRLGSHAGPLIVVARQTEFYPPAAVALGIPTDRIIWVRPGRHADAVWSIDQALRCESVAAVWAPIGAELDDRDARRFQLASETGRTPGLFLRPSAVRGRPSFADTRFHVRLADGRGSLKLPDPALVTLQVTVDRCRGATGGRSVTVQIDDRGRLKTLHFASPSILPRRSSNHETAAVRLASELAHPKTTNGGSARRRA